MKNTQPYFQAKNFKFIPTIHYDKNIIQIIFPRNNELLIHLKTYTKPKWSSTKKSWYVADTQHYRNLFGMPQKNLGREALAKISTMNLPEFIRFEEQLILRGFSKNTQRTYCTEFAQLLFLLGNFPVQNLTPKRISSYILYCHKELMLSENQIHSRMNALKFYFEKILGFQKMFFEIPRPKKPQLLPKFLTQDEIIKIIKATENLKHRLIIQLCYGMGLRVSEIVKIRIEDIDSRNMRVFISKAKGKKDRYVNLPKSLLPELRKYYKEYAPKIYLFEGQYGGMFSIRSVHPYLKPL